MSTTATQTRKSKIPAKPSARKAQGKRSASSKTAKSAHLKTKAGDFFLHLPKPCLALPCPSGKIEVPVTLHSPQACNVSIAGCFNGWQPSPLRRQDNGHWHIELSLLPGVYEYLFVVDGEWLPDPACDDGCPNPFGGENSVLRV